MWPGLNRFEPSIDFELDNVRTGMGCMNLVTVITWQKWVPVTLNTKIVTYVSPMEVLVNGIKILMGKIVRDCFIILFWMSWFLELKVEFQSEQCWVQEYVLVLMMATFLQKTPRGLTLPYQWKWNRLVTWIFKESWVFQCKLLQNRMTTKPHLGIDCSNICIHHRVTEEQFPRAREVQRWACSTCTLRLLLPSTNLWLWLGEESEAAGSLPTREEGYGLCEWITRLATTVEWVCK